MSRKSHSRKRSDNNQTGSPKTGEPVFLAIGRLGKPHGVRGEINLHVMTDFPERIQPGTQVFLGDAHDVHTITAVREHTKTLLVRFKYVNSREDVGLLRGQMVYRAMADVPTLPDGEFYQHQLIGLQVYEGERLLGELAQIIHTGANKVYVVRKPEGGELLLPAIDDVIQTIDLEAKQILVQLMPGLE